MIDMYIKCGFLECGRKVFDEMPNKDAISWTELFLLIGIVGTWRVQESCSNNFDGLFDF
jgi:pentatricopeptide repeat protein